MPSEKLPQIIKFTPLYVDFYNTLKPVVRNVLNNDQVDRVTKVKAAADAVSSIRNLTSQMFEVLDDPQKREVAELIAKAEKTNLLEDRKVLETKLRDLFPGEFPNKTYHSFVDAIAETTNAILTGYAKDLKDVPKTFGELLVSATRQKAREALAGQTEVQVPELAVVQETKGTYEPEPQKPTPKPSGAEQQKFETWKKGWFEGEIDLRKLEDVKKQLVVKEDGSGNKFADFIDVSNRGISNIDNYEELREVAVLRMAVMYATNEVNEESFRRENFDIIWMQAERIRQKIKKETGRDTEEFATYTKNMINAMREFYVFWNAGWIGYRHGTGVGVDMKSIATFASRFPDQHKYWAFLLEQKAVNSAFHREVTSRSASYETEKINGNEAKSELWKMIGRRIRRSTGAAIYDGIRYIKNEQDVAKIESVISGHKKLDTETEEESQQRLDIEMANAIFEMNGMKYHTIDYQLFLNHCIPWYLEVRYRQKFKDRVDLLERYNRNAEDLAKRLDLEGTQLPRLMDPNSLKRVRESFKYFNIGEISAYSMWKRPDMSSAWLNNLKQITLAAQAEKEPELLDRREADLVKAKKKELDELGTPGKKPRTSENIENINADYDAKQKYEVDKIREMLNSFGDDKELLHKFIENGLNFGMKMIGFYEPEMDRRAGKLKSLSKWDSFGISDWGADNLKRQSFEKKLDILQKFLDPNTVVATEQHEIIRNNLIRTVPITQEAEEKLAKMSLAQQSWYRMSIFQEYIDLDELRLEENEKGDSWMRFFNNMPFSFNAFMIYEVYASGTREDIHKMFSTEDSDIQGMLKLAKGLESMSKFKHLVDTSLAEFSPETGGYKELKQATAWRIERTMRAIEEYVSSMYMLTIATYRKMGVRGPLAENVNQIVSNGIKEGFFKAYHFEPAMSEREEQEGLEFSYGKIENHQKMGNDFKLRYLLNLLGFEGNKQRTIWEKGFLKNISLEGQPVSYDVLLLMAGLRERRDDEIKPGEIRGYVKDGEVANGWYDFYLQSRQQLTPAPQTQILDPKFVSLLVERAKNLPQFSGKSEPEIRKGLDAQFAILHKEFSDRVYGLFSGIMMYQRNLGFVYEQVLDSYIQNTFDEDRSYVTGAKVKENWPDRKWEAPLDFVSREKFKSKLARQRRFAIAGGEGFNRYILTQVAYGNFVNPYDKINYETDTSGNFVLDSEGRPKSKYLHGVDDIESWLMGSGELDFGKAKRLTRLPNYWNSQGLYFLYRAIFGPATAIAAHANSMSPEWEDGEIRSFKDRRVMIGPWTNIINPEKWRRILESFKDPFGESIMGWDQIEKLSELSGCTTYQIGKFHDEREWRKVMDLEVGPDAALTKEEKEGLGFLDRPASLLVELPTTAAGAEIGGILGLKELWKNISEAGSVGRGTALANATVAGLLGAGIGAAGLLGGPITGAAILAGAGGLLFTGPTVSVNDEAQIKRNIFVKALFDWKPSKRYWKWVAKNSPRIPGTNIPLFNLPIVGGTIFGSIRNLKQMGRDSEVMLVGREPVWDDLVAIKPIIEDFKWQKEHLKIDADYFTKAKS
jgi:hypothetical protein